jgi:Mrp family chromosome partitioning ATPase
LGLVAAITRERAHGPIRETDALPDDVPLLVSVPAAETPEPVVTTAPGSPPAEAYRRLATTLRGSLSPGAVIVVSPLTSNAANASVAVNLAFAASRDGRAVTLVLTSPPSDEIAASALPLPQDTPGLTEALADGQDPLTLRIEMAPSLHVLPPGRTGARSRELFASARMRTIVDLLGNAADLVVVAAPPVSHPDGQAISIVADGVILTCVLGTSTQRQLLAAVAHAHHVRADVLGVVATAPSGAPSGGRSDPRARPAPSRPTTDPSGVRVVR